MRADAGAPADTPTYLLEQSFRYTYASPARRLRHRLMVVPRSVHGGQYLFDHGLKVSGSSVRVSVSSDRYANHIVDMFAPDVPEWIEFNAWALVGRRESDGVSGLARATADDRRLLTPTPLTRPDAALLEAAFQLMGDSSGRSGAFGQPGDGLDFAERACSWTHRTLTYTPGVTGVDTTASSALALGQGVCQDFAHVMLSLCRVAGVPARYVSGHLVGEGASHAWVEVVDRSGGRAVAVAFDPTHDRRAGAGYLTVAVGRDYADVAPTSGTFVGECAGVLSAHKRLSLTGS